MSETWFTSDSHFFHERIIELCDRPFESVEEMNESLLENWNTVVGKDDSVFFLGDLSFGKRTETEALIGRLRGQIHVIKGNHDPTLNRFADRFASYQDYLETRFGGQLVVMSHYPMLTWNRAHHGSWMLHGHCHGGLAPSSQPRHDVGVDANDFQLLNLETIERLMIDKQYEPVDHHKAQGTKR